MPRKIEISHKTIIFTFLVIGVICFLYQIREIIFILFISLLLMTILNPLVKKLSKFRVPRAIPVLIVYFCFFGVVIFSLVSIFPTLIDQTSNFVANLPSYIANIHVPPALSDQFSRQILEVVGSLPSKFINLGVWIVSNIFNLLTILTFAFYLLMARNKLDGQLSRLIGEKRGNEVGEILDELEKKLGGWAQGQIMLMLSIGILMYVGYFILGIHYPLPLAIFAGALEIVPYVGPILGAIPAIIIGFGMSPVLGIATCVLAFLIHQLENYVLAPKIMQKSVGVPPLATLLALTIGFRVAGITGVLISVPLVITGQVLLKRRFLA